MLAGKPFAVFSTSRRYYKRNLKTIRELGEKSGGQFVDDTHFVADGNQVMSMWSWLVFMRHDVEKRRWFGVPLPKPNLKVGFEEQATSFINGVADKVFTPSDRRLVTQHDSLAPATAMHVVITGTSTGIGAACALAPRGRGFLGLRRRTAHEADATALAKRTSGELTPLLIDITDAGMHRGGGRDRRAGCG